MALTTRSSNAQKAAAWEAEAKARLEQSLGVGTRHAGWGGGGAADHAESMNRAQFRQSPIGIWAYNAGGQALFDKEFNKKWHGGAVPLNWGESLSPAKFDQYVASIGGNPYAQAAWNDKTAFSRAGSTIPRQNTKGGRAAPGRRQKGALAGGQPTPQMRQKGALAGGQLTPQMQQGMQQGRQRLQAIQQQKEQQRQQQQQQAMQQQAAAEKEKLLYDMLESAKQAREDANRANIARYGEGHGELTEGRDRIMGNLYDQQARLEATASGPSEYELMELDDSYRQNSRRMLDDASRVGLSSDTTRKGQIGRDFYELQKQRALLEQNARKELQGILQQGMATTNAFDEKLTNKLVGFIERRDDTGPSLESIWQMAKDYGEAGEGQGFGGQVAATGGGLPQAAAFGRPAQGGGVNTPFGPAVSASANPNFMNQLTDQGVFTNMFGMGGGYGGGQGGGQGGGTQQALNQVAQQIQGGQQVGQQGGQLNPGAVGAQGLRRQQMINAQARENAKLQHRAEVRQRNLDAYARSPQGKDNPWLHEDWGG